jgi:hypothetical protein
MQKAFHPESMSSLFIKYAKACSLSSSITYTYFVLMSS